MRNWGDTVAAYRFLSNEAISHEQIMAPHWMQTREAAMRCKRVLLVADTTDINLSSHETITGGGPIGWGNKARGFFVHTVLAMDADSQQFLGCMYQEPFIRQPARDQAKLRRSVRNASVNRKSGNAAWNRWERYRRSNNGSMSEIVAATSTRVSQACERLGYDFVIRVAHDRCVLLDAEEDTEDETHEHLKTLARLLTAQGGQVLQVPAQRQRPAREAFVQISWQQVRIQQTSSREPS